MTLADSSHPQAQQQDTGGWVALGGSLFRYRTALPVPLALLLLLVPAQPAGWTLMGAGLAVTCCGELIRIWGVRHIGAISRTRSDRLGPLIDSGPFARLRNPLYLGNVLIWVGFAVATRQLWLAPVIALLLAVEYHAIVRWEEQLLVARRGDEYRRYVERVPRWVPRLTPPASTHTATLFSWRDTFFSERGTLIAILVGVALVWAKSRL